MFQCDAIWAQNAGIIRSVNYIFESKIGKIAQFHINDMLIKSLEDNNYLEHLEEAFTIL